MATIEDFFPTYIDSFKADVGARASHIEQLSNEEIILRALELIMEEQQRTGHRSEDWPSNDHNATRFVLHNRARRER